MTALNGLAARVGTESLRDSGSAMDAALATAFVQIVLGGGAVTSFFGILGIVHFDAKSSEVTSLNAGWNTCREENDPLSIPGDTNPSGDGLAEMMKDSEPSGRTALVGGFLRGAEAAHRRFGRLPWAALFAPAIELAVNGFSISPQLARYITTRQADLARLPQTRAIFLRADGSLFDPGDWFRQPALAQTLRRIANDGADYVFTGEWASRCVVTVRADGGKMTIKDLIDYEPIWSHPIKFQQGDFQLAMLGPPSKGGYAAAECLNLAVTAGIPALGPWRRNPESLRRIALCCGATGGMRYENVEQLSAVFPGIDMSSEARLDKEHAIRLWERLDSDHSPIHLARAGTHSDDVVAADRWGNMVSLCHSINCLIWGRTAIAVDGITIGDPASYMQTQIAAIPPGSTLANPMQLGILLRDGQVHTAWASMGVGLHYMTAQSLLAIMQFHLPIEEVSSLPRLLFPSSPDRKQTQLSLRFVEGEFPEELLKGIRLGRKVPFAGGGSPRSGALGRNWTRS
ncbi:MAG: gamma-glutamyltransferase [Brevundimonas sp.]|nr:gamma-glutamyltransferase [Brevundimonas sp.]